jgi:hypothetical protein
LEYGQSGRNQDRAWTPVVLCDGEQINHMMIAEGPTHIPAKIPMVSPHNCVPTDSVNADTDYASRHEDKEHKDDFTNWPLER